VRESPADQIDDVPHLLYRVRRLGGHTNARMLLEGQNVSSVEHDVNAIAIEIAGEAAHLHVVTLSDDNDVVASVGKRPDRSVRNVHEGARRFDHRQSQSPRACERALGRAVRRHHEGGRFNVCDILRDLDALGVEGAQNGWIVDEVTKNGQRAGICMREREGNGIANAETHAEMRCLEEPHTLRRKV
jgi:hypothetical protein